jgi:hypothetical protein
VLKTLAGLLVAGAAEKVSIVLAEPSVPSALSPVLQAASAAGEASETIGGFSVKGIRLGILVRSPI